VSKKFFKEQKAVEAAKYCFAGLAADIPDFNPSTG